MTSPQTSPSFAEAVRRNEVLNIAQASIKGDSFVLDDTDDVEEDVFINPDYFYDG